MENRNREMPRRRFTDKDIENILMAPNSKPFDVLYESCFKFTKILIEDVTTPSDLAEELAEIFSKIESDNATYVFDKLPSRKKEVLPSEYKKRKSPKTDSSSEEKIKYKEKTKRRKTYGMVKSEPLSVQLTLPEVFENRIRQMNGYDIKLLIQKNIFDTDLARGQNRFSIPVKQIRDDAKDFLTQDETDTLNRRFEDKHVEFLEVPLLEPILECTTIKFRKWNLKTSYSYVLSEPWSLIQKRNKLQVGMTMQVWSFRVDTKLHLALVNLMPENTQEELDH